MRERIPALSNVIIRTIEKFAADAYKDVAKEKSVPLQEVHDGPHCEEVTAKMHRAMSASPIFDSVKLEKAFEGLGAHTFIIATIKRVEYVVDPTWKQVLLLRLNRSGPKVMIVERSSVSAFAEKYDISDVWSREEVAPHSV